MTASASQHPATRSRLRADARRRLPCTNRLFVEMSQYHTGYLAGQISPESEEFGIKVIAALREAVGPNVGILLDAHGHYNVPTCVRLCRRLEPYNLGWFEEPTPPESIQALRSVREQVNVPI